MASGEMSPAEFERFLKTAFANMADVSVQRRHPLRLHGLAASGRADARCRRGLFELKNLCVWNKDNGGMGSFYRSKHELVFVYKVGTDPHVNTIDLGAHGRYRTNVWDYAGINTWRAGRDASCEMHPTVKPTALVIDAIKDCSRRGDMVLDAFCRLRHHDHGRAQVRPQGPRHGARPALCRRRDPPLAGLHRGGRHARHHRRDLRRDRRSARRSAAVNSVLLDITKRTETLAAG